jgi:hypothetical protein
MTLEIFRVVTPFITLLLMVGVWVIGWLVKRLIAESGRHFADLKKELKHKIDQRSWELEKRMDKLERDLEKLEASRLVDQKYLYEQFVSKEGFYRTVGKTESSIGRIFKLINELNKAANRRR